MSLSNPMYTLIERLFREAPKMLRPDGAPDTSQTPALECHVALKGHHTVHYGALSWTPEGLLRMLTAGEVQDPGAKSKRMTLFETFFHVDDVASITVERKVEAAQPTSRIITS